MQNFASLYHVKTDEELIQLAAEPEHLTSEALLALQGELSRRQITIAAPFGAPVQRASRDRADTSLGTPERQSVGDFVAEVLQTYHSNFWLYFKIAIPAVVISTVAIIGARHETRELAHALLRGSELPPYKMLEIGFINFTAYLTTWTAFFFSYGATCIAADEIAGGFTPSPSHCFSSTRERLGTFLRLCLLLFVLLAAAEAGAALLDTSAFRGLRHWHVHTPHFLGWIFAYAAGFLAVLVWSRFGLAVPGVILDDYKVGQAIFRSDALTRGKWPILATLLAKSIIGGYIASMLPFWLASPAEPLPSWFHWILTGVSIAGVASVEPTLFLGFSLLYLKGTAQTEIPSQLTNVQLA